MYKLAQFIILFFVLSIFSENANAQSRYVVDCGSATEYTTATSEAGMRCPNPFGNACTAAQVGNSFGQATCSIISESFGNPGPQDGQPSIENCTCIID